MERLSRNFQPSSSAKTFQAIFASSYRYFTENSLWVPLKHDSENYHMVVACVICRMRKLRRITLSEASIILAFNLKPNSIIFLIQIMHSLERLRKQEQVPNIFARNFMYKIAIQRSRNAVQTHNVFSAMFSKAGVNSLKQVF